MLAHHPPCEMPTLERALNAALNVWPVSDLVPLLSSTTSLNRSALSHEKGTLSLSGNKGNLLHKAIKTRNEARLKELLALPRRVTVELWVYPSTEREAPTAILDRQCGCQASSRNPQGRVRLSPWRPCSCFP